MTSDTEKTQAKAAAWFRELRDLLCAEFEAIEDELTGTFSDREPGKFERTTWKRPVEKGMESGGGEMSVMRGRAFEKVGVNFSEVRGVFSDEFRGQIKGTEDDPSFWACGISLVSHMRSPLVPAAHMNTRHIVT